MGIGKKSKSKGSRGERITRDKFTEWWGSKFTSSPQSGAFATRTQFSSMAGDLVTDDESFPFCVENKNQEDWTLEELFTAPSSRLFEFWKQTVGQTPEGKIPMLVFTKNYRPLFFMLPLVTFASVIAPKDSKFPYVTFNAMLEEPDHYRMVAIGLLHDFQEHTSPEDWRRYVLQTSD